MIGHMKHWGIPNARERQRIKRIIPMSAVLLYLQTCPVCASSKKILKMQKNPLNFIGSQKVGSPSQVDLINMRSHELNEMKWILCYVDNLSDFSQICCLPNKSSTTVGETIVQKLSAAFGPMILQSDNGSEFFAPLAEWSGSEIVSLKSWVRWLKKLTIHKVWWTL